LRDAVRQRVGELRHVRAGLVVSTEARRPACAREGGGTEALHSRHRVPPRAACAKKIGDRPVP